MNMTYAKAKQLLSPGDTVFIVEGGQVVELPILRIHQDSLSVPDGYLYFDDIRTSWWLTKKVATDALNGGIAW